jgi:hypothetical protein
VGNRKFPPTENPSSRKDDAALFADLLGEATTKAASSDKDFDKAAAHP